MWRSPARFRGRTRRPERPLPWSAPSTFREREHAWPRHDEVIENPDVDERQCSAQASRDQFVGLTPILNGRRVIVYQESRRRAPRDAGTLRG